MYAHIHDGVIAAPQELPQTWSHPDGRTVSNLHALNDDELVQLGWYPVTQSDVPNFDPSAQIADGVLTLTGTHITQSWTIRELSDAEKSAWLTQQRASLTASIWVHHAARMTSGYVDAASGKAFDCSDASLAKFAAMGATAVAVKQGLASWPSNYATGWIANDGSRLALNDADAGLAFTLAVQNWVSASIQHAQDLQNQVVAAANPLTINLAQGWP
jgi:hypothetical protein